MSKKKSGAKDSKSASHTCGGCKNFKPRKGKSGGMCTRRDKKRSADDKACGHYDPR